MMDVQNVVRLRRTPPPGLGQMLGQARMRRGWRLRECARLLGLSPSYLLRLETGERVPSVTVARRLIDGLELEAAESAVLLAAAVDDAGRDHPAKRVA